MKLRVVDGNKLILQCVPGDKYYTIEDEKEIDRRICEDKASRGLIVLENSKVTGKRIKEHTWLSYAQIYRI